MLQTVVATVAVLMVAVAVMAVGVIFGQRRLQGSCGGVPNSACKCSDARRAECETKHNAGDASERLVDIPRSGP